MRPSKLASWFALAAAGTLLNVAASDGLSARYGTFSPADQKAIIASAEEVKKSILAEDVPALLRLVTRKEGLMCTDTVYSLDEIRAFLGDKHSELYLGLFRSEGTAENSFSVARLEADWAKVTITSPIKSHYPREWYFRREGSAWKLAGASFIIGRCTCG